MVGLGRQNIAVPVLKYHRVIDVGGYVGCSISCIACTVDYLGIPACKGIGVRIVRCLGGISRCCHLVTIVVGLGGKNCSIPILEYHSVIDVAGSIGCGISCIAITIHYITIPTGKYVDVRVICRLGRISRNCYRITVVIDFAANYTTIIVFEYDNILDIGGCKHCCICGISFTYCNIRTPTNKCIGVRLIRRFLRRSRHFNRLTIVVSCTADYTAIPVLECDCIFDIFGRICCSIGHIALAGSYITVPTNEVIIINFIRRRYRNNRYFYCITIVICFTANNTTVIVLKYYRIIDKRLLINRSADNITLTNRCILIPTNKFISINLVCWSAHIGWC